MSILKWDRRGAEAFDTSLLQAAFDNQMKAYSGIGDVGKIFDESVRANKELALKEQLQAAQLADYEAKRSGKGYYSKTGSGRGNGSGDGVETGGVYPGLVAHLQSKQQEQQDTQAVAPTNTSVAPVDPNTPNNTAELGATEAALKHVLASKAQIEDAPISAPMPTKNKEAGIRDISNLGRKLAELQKQQTVLGNAPVFNSQDSIDMSAMSPEQAMAFSTSRQEARQAETQAINNQINDLSTKLKTVAAPIQETVNQEGDQAGTLSSYDTSIGILQEKINQLRAQNVPTQTTAAPTIPATQTTIDPLAQAANTPEAVKGDFLMANSEQLGGMLESERFSGLPNREKQQVLSALNVEFTKQQAPDVNIARLQAGISGKDPTYLAELEKSNPDFYNWVLADIINSESVPKTDKERKNYVLGLNKRWYEEIEQRKDIISAQQKALKERMEYDQEDKTIQKAMEDARASLLTDSKSVVRTALDDSYEGAGRAGMSRFINLMLNLKEFQDTNPDYLASVLENAIRLQRASEFALGGGKKASFSPEKFKETLVGQLQGIATPEQVKAIDDLKHR